MQGKKIIIAHNWKETSFNTQSVKLAKAFAETNEVLFISQSRLVKHSININKKLTVIQWPNKRPTTFQDFIFCYKTFKHFKPDIVISRFGAHNIVTLVCFILHIKNRISWYDTIKEAIDLDFKGSPLKYNFSRIRKKAIYKLEGYVLSVSNYAIKEVTSYYNVPLKRIRQIHNGLADTEIRNINNGELIFGFLGRYDECKGIDVLLQAIAIVKKQVKSIKFNIAGGKLSATQLKMIQQLQIEDVINEIGHIQYDKVLPYVASHYAMIVPSRVDNLNTVVLESFSTATPVIGSNAGGIPEMIQHEQNGLLFATGNHQQLAEQILKLAKSEFQRNTMAANARATFEEKFTIPVYVKNVTAFLNTLN